MEHKLTKIFQKSKYTPDTDLVVPIWQKINTKEKQNARLKFWVFSFFGLSSLAGLIPAFQTLATDFSHSGFSSYLSLVLSDSGMIFTYWKEFSFSLLESLPLSSIILTLSLVFIFFLSLRHLMRQINKGQIFSTSVLSI